MLESLDLNQSLSKAQYQEALQPLRRQLADLQRVVKNHKRPVIILLEGMQASGKNDSIRLLADPLNPVGFKVHLTQLQGTDEERLRPPLWRFWMRIPRQGEIKLFDGGWYLPFIHQRARGELDDSAWSARKDAIRQFERQLADDGAILLKFWLHIDQKEQKKRLKTWVRSPYEGWRVTREDWKIHKNFKEYLRIADELLVETDTPYAPWTMVAAHDKRHRRIQVLRTAVETLERTAREGVRSVTYISSVPSTLETRLPGYTSILDRVDLSKKLERPQYLHRLAECQKRLRDLEFAAYAERLPVIVVYEGWDASGKGGNIKRVTQKLDPHGYDVIPVSKPEGEEANHHYLWRFWRHLPKAGHIAIFDRSWYGRVMVERVEGFSREEAWKRAYYEINEFERRLADYGTVIVKFWLHISKEEQLQRFQDRERKPHKQYKLTDEDWRNREKWEAYALAVNEMLERTSTPHAPWTVVEGNDKLWARIKTLDTLIAAIETALQRSPR